ncbi:MAG: glutathione S-transferase family protein [Alphaproteobacteria bacterium]|nr:glutathione S-transferase family protein [Alphaproteobacteria bacterium]
MAGLELVIGNKAWSSWSLRPWLVLKAAGVPFTETLVALRQPNTRAEALKHAPSGHVPVLKHDGLAIWDSLAICEYLAETFPQAQLWPADKAARARARSVSAEMHSGFGPLRAAMSMDVKARHPTPPMTPELAANIARVQELWNQCRREFGAKTGKPFLFGAFTIADAMYAPVGTRFVTYGVKLDDVSTAYVKSIVELPAMKEWTAAA